MSRFWIEDEIIPTVVKHAYGPCIECDRDTEYGKRVLKLGIQFGQPWFEKEFQSEVRSRNLEALHKGVAPKGRSLKVLEDFLCETCRAALLEKQWANTPQRDKELLRRARASYRYRLRSTVSADETYSN